MIRDVLATADLSQWPTLALVFFVAFFGGLLIWLLWPGQRERLEAYRAMPFDDSTVHPVSDAGAQARRSTALEEDPRGR